MWNKFPDCKFICDAHQSKAGLPELEKQKEDADEKLDRLDNEIEKLDPRRLERHSENYEKVLDKQRDLKEKQSKIELDIERSKNKITTIEHSLEKLGAKITEYEENKEAIENLEILLKDCNKKKKAKTSYENQLQNCEDLILELYKQHGSLEQKHTNLLEQKQEMLDLRKDILLMIFLCDVCIRMVSLWTLLKRSYQLSMRKLVRSWLMLLISKFSLRAKATS